VRPLTAGQHRFAAASKHTPRPDVSVAASELQAEEAPNSVGLSGGRHGCLRLRTLRHVPSCAKAWPH
jgi:hypothetical protein